MAKGRSQPVLTSQNNQSLNLDGDSFGGVQLNIKQRLQIKIYFWNHIQQGSSFRYHE